MLGFAISALLQTVVSTDEMKRAFGRSGPKEIALSRKNPMHHHGDGGYDPAHGGSGHAHRQG